jgi:hypothetical protein
MDHDSRFDQLVTATEELVHENERVRAKFKAFEAALREYLENQRNCCALRSLAHSSHGSSSIPRHRSIPTGDVCTKSTYPVNGVTSYHRKVSLPELPLT